MKMFKKLPQNKSLLALFFVFLIGAFFRCYNLTHVPPSASLDEATIGYNAYSILHTGADEYGTKFPILLRAYDDFRPALYVYMVIPFIKLLGLTVTAVRLPSVLLSLFTIVATYFLTKELFKKHKYVEQIALFSSILLAISPWDIYISRLGHEANAGLAFGIFGILFLMKFIHSKKGFFSYPASLFLSLSFYAYQSEKIFIPLIVLAFSAAFRNELWQFKKKIIGPLILGIVLCTPVLLALLSPNGLIRLKGTSAFSDRALYSQSAKNVLLYKKEGNKIGEFLNNRRLVPVTIFFTNYFSHFSPVWLAQNSGNEDFKAPGVGLIYTWEIPLIILGFFFLFVKKFDKKIIFVLLIWLFSSPVAASLTTGAPHAMRAYNFLPLGEIFSAISLVYIYSVMKDYRTKLAASLIFFAVIFFSSVFFYKQYFTEFPLQESSSFQYALSKSIPFVLTDEKKYKIIVFSNEKNLYQSYMFFLFYSRYDPFLYQNEGGTKSGGFAEIHTFSKYSFYPFDFVKDKSNTLYIGNISDFPDFVTPLKKFKNLDEKEVIEAVSK